MNVTPVQKTLINIRKVAANPKFAEFARSTVCAIAIETTLKHQDDRLLFIMTNTQTNNLKNMQQQKNCFIKLFVSVYT